ncbi:I78 family peptidase inhibitor [Paracoccus sp. (in: a-proteobacteria)]|uniref:I78 family peptidase inhibitor n=1 Tax=Paracoccus sp. TaxID=267 RepID=UPI003A839001
MRILTLFPLLSALALAACDDTAPKPPTPPELPQECGAEGFTGLVGQPKSVLDGLKLPDGTRIIGPDDAVTADFRPDRLNIETGPDGLIAKVSCY